MIFFYSQSPLAFDALLCSDTQLYLAFKPVDTATQDTAVSAMKACLRDIRQWMIKDKLMINDEKTKFMMIGTKEQLT